MNEDNSKKSASDLDDVPVMNDKAATPTKPNVGKEKPARKSQRKVTRSPKPEALARKRTNPVVWLLVGVNTVLLLALAGAGFYGWQQWQLMLQTQEQQRLADKSSLETRLVTQIEQVASGSVAKINTVAEQFRQNASQNEQRFNEVFETLTVIKSDNPHNQRLSEIQYLLRMTTRKTFLEYNPTAALKILQEADRLAMQDSTLTPLRALIAKDMQALRVAELVTPEEQAIKLSALLQQANELKFRDPEMQFRTPQRAMSDEWSWQNVKIFLANARDSFLRVEKLDIPLEPYLDKQQTMQISVAMQYHLLTARHGLLQRDRQLFSAAMQGAQELLSHYDETQPSLQVFIDALKGILQQARFDEKPLRLKSPGYFTATESVQIGV